MWAKAQAIQLLPVPQGPVIRMLAQLRLLEAPLQGSRAAFGDLAVDQQRQPVLEGHVVEVMAPHLFEEGCLQAGQAQLGNAFGQGVGNGIVGHL